MISSAVEDARVPNSEAAGAGHPPGRPSDWAARSEDRLLDAAIGLGADVAWGADLVRRAAKTAGLSPADTELLTPHGARDLAALLWRRHDRAALSALAGVDPSSLKVRERIRTAVEARVEAAADDAEASRAAARFLARPDQAGFALRLAWASADQLWRWAGDTSTDQNHYTKRAILSGVLASTAAVRLSRGRDAALEHLDARIANVMAFETWKAKLPSFDGALTAVAGALGRLRYGR